MSIQPCVNSFVGSDSEDDFGDFAQGANNDNVTISRVNGFASCNNNEFRTEGVNKTTEFDFVDESTLIFHGDSFNSVNNNEDMKSLRLVLDDPSKHFDLASENNFGNLKTTDLRCDDVSFVTRSSIQKRDDVSHNLCKSPVTLQQSSGEPVICDKSSDISKSYNKSIPVSDVEPPLPPEEETSDDDFADFTNAPTEEEKMDQNEPSVSQIKEATDDFGDFADFESSAAKIEEPANFKGLSYKFDKSKVREIITSIFQKTAEIPEVNLRSLIESNDKIWNSIKHVEETNALTFQWANSSSNNKLLKALGIDSRNILFGPKWNPNVPRFAANLSFSPMEPIKASSSEQKMSPTSPQDNPKNSEEVPAAQFDWTSSGLTNPLDGNVTEPQDKNQRKFPESVSATGSTSRDLKKAKGHLSHYYKAQLQAAESSLPDFKQPASSKHNHDSENVVTDRYGRPMPVQTETVKVLKQLPDISFLSAKTLMYSPEQKQIVTDLGAMINRKMPG